MKPTQRGTSWAAAGKQQVLSQESRFLGCKWPIQSECVGVSPSAVRLEYGACCKTLTAKLNHSIQHYPLNCCQHWDQHNAMPGRLNQHLQSLGAQKEPHIQCKPDPSTAACALLHIGFSMS